jgi:hypothetical protein
MAGAGAGPVACAVLAAAHDVSTDVEAGLSLGTCQVAAVFNLLVDGVDAERRTLG